MAREAPGQTLQATALVHEAYLRLLDGEPAQSWNSRGHFFAAAAEAMRRILVERARHRQSLKAGGDCQRQELPDIELADAGSRLDLLALHEALNRLEQQNRRRAELVKLRFFTGLTIAEAARALGISESTADNDWAYARSWLRLEIEGFAGSGELAEDSQGVSWPRRGRTNRPCSTPRAASTTRRSAAGTSARRAATTWPSPAASRPC
jgi:RNA polymerase sigma factor (TIGR02999 family)